MRFPSPRLLAGLCLGFAFCFAAAPVSATQIADNSRTFVIAAQADGYGIDECLASGASCGVHAARAYCKSRDFTDASAYRQIDPTEITATVPEFANTSCRGSSCGRPIAITCAR